MTNENTDTKSDADIVPQPENGFGSRHNYALWKDAMGDCGYLRDLSVKITINQSVVYASSTGPARGFSFQLNTYSNQYNSAWQQYIVALRDNDLHGVINNWKCEETSVESESREQTLTSIIDHRVELCKLTDNTVPEGYTITISPFANKRADISGVNFKVVNASGVVLADKTQELLMIHNVTKSELAPIVALEMVLVGLPKDAVTLRKGAGCFEYSAAAPLKVSPTLPPCVASHNGTAETANTSYGTLDAGPANPITQTFAVTKNA